MARLPFYLGGNEVHDESPAQRLRREAEERRARDLLSRAAAMGRYTGGPEANPPPDVTTPMQAPAASTSTAVAMKSTGVGSGAASRVAIPSARARLLDVVAAESPRVAAYLRESMAPELEAAQEEAQGRRLGVNIGRAGAMVNEAISGARYDRGAYDGLEAEADRPVTDLAARAEVARQDWQDTGAAQDRQARLQGFEDDRADRSAQRALEMARDTRGQQERVEDATRSDAAREQSRQDAAAARGQQQRQWEAEMELKRKDAEAKAARGPGGAAGLPPEERLAKATAGAKVSPIVSSLERIEQLLPGSTSGGAQSGGADAWSRTVTNLPGGWGSWLATDKGLSLTKEVQNLRDVVKRARSGAAITDQEEQAYLRLIDDAALSDPRALAIGLDVVRREVGQKLADINAGFDPAVVQRYQERGGTTAQSPIVAGQRPPDINLNSLTPTGRRATMPDGSVWEELSDGSSRQVR